MIPRSWRADQHIASLWNFYRGMRRGAQGRTNSVLEPRQSPIHNIFLNPLGTSPLPGRNRQVNRKISHVRSIFPDVTAPSLPCRPPRLCQEVTEVAAVGGSIGTGNFNVPDSSELTAQTKQFVIDSS